MTDDGPPTIMVPAKRILVVEDLGDVRRGDHLIMVANVIVSHDTSRQSVVAIPLSHQVNKRARINHIDSITRDVVYTAIKELGPTTSMRISDHLRLERNDSSGRGKVSRMIAALKQSKRIERYMDDHTKMYTYKALSE